MSAIVSGLNLTVTDGVVSKVDTTRFDDPKFAQFEPNGISGFMGYAGITSPVSTENGISSPTTNRSVEGLGIGGYDPNFNVF